MSKNRFDPQQRAALLAAARKSIVYGAKTKVVFPLDLEDWESTFQAHGACFVTLRKEERLRGCIGSLRAYRALIEDVVNNAYAAALQDPRFPCVRPDEVGDLSIHLSILGPASPIDCGDEPSLLATIRPGVDGLILADGPRRATFLPSVWAQLPTPQAFVHALKQKMGVSPDYWSDTLRVSRYGVESFTEDGNA